MQPIQLKILFKVLSANYYFNLGCMMTVVKLYIRCIISLLHAYLTIKN